MDVRPGDFDQLSYEEKKDHQAIGMVRNLAEQVQQARLHYSGSDPDEAAMVLDEQFADAYAMYLANLQAASDKYNSTLPDAQVDILTVLEAFKYRYPSGHTRQLAFREKLYIANFMACGHSPQAASKAGYASPELASRRFQKDPRIKAALMFCLDARNKRLALNGDKLVRETALLAFSDLGDVMENDEHGALRMKQLDAIAPEARRTIKKITVVRAPNGTETVNVELHDKGQAQQLLAKMMGMLQQRVEVRHEGAIVEEIAKARERAEQAGRLRITTEQVTERARIIDVTAERIPDE